MPTRRKRGCIKPGCPGTTTDRSGYCDKHQPAAGAGWSQWQSKKGNTTQRGYGAAWRKRRSRILNRDNHLCQEHLKKDVVMPGNHVDHIIPKAQGGDDSDTNLQTLCKSCHQRKTATERTG